MAGVSVWLLAVIALMPPVGVAVGAGLVTGAARRLIAVEFLASLIVLVMVLMSFAFDQPSLVDLPLTIAFLSLPGTLVFAHFLERWL
jgi:multisubunit Na+/H+ antiporter MnhF subunit